MICDLHSPDTFDTRLGERASANVQPWDYNSYIYKAMVQVVEALNVEAILKVFNTEGR